MVSAIGRDGGGILWEESGSDKSENDCRCPRQGLFHIEVLLLCRHHSMSLISSTIERREEYIHIPVMKCRLSMLYRSE